MDSKRDRNIRKKEMKNELTKLIPGYKAPLRLASSVSAQNESLEELRRKALRMEQTNSLATTRKKMNNLATSTPGAAEKSFSSSISSFKTGHKRKSNPTADAGAGWFHMQPSAMTEEVKHDLTLIKNRNYLDPKRFYKSSDPTSKYFQVGTVVEGTGEFFSSRLTKKQRRSNLTEEIMADSSLYDYTRRKYADMQREKQQAALKRKPKKNSKRKKAFKL